jgi:Trypsin/Trypsin-like peptidase domain
MGLSRDLVVEIYSPANHAVGSGYFCTSRLILTAKHVVSGALPKVGPTSVSTLGRATAFEQVFHENRTVCRVRSLSAGGGGPFVDAIPVWWSESADVALLALKAEGTQAGVSRTVTWADVREGDPIDVTAVGFPQADTENRVRESRQISGRLNPFSGVKGNRLIIHVSGSIAELPAGVGSSWAGMSGAALFAGELLIGVVLGDADVVRSERLELWALPARAFADDRAFLDWIRWDAGEDSWIFSSDSPPSSMALLTEIAKANRQFVRERPEHETKPIQDNRTRESGSVSTTPRKQLISHIPYPRNPNFTGREAQLETMHSALTSRRTAALTQAIAGLGGVGKTQLAMEYSYRYAGEYDVIWWIRSELQETRLNDIVALGKALDAITSNMDASASLRATLDCLDRRSGWLLVFDNAETPNQIRDLLPKARNGSIIITSRFGAWGAVAQTLQIDSWSPKEAVAFLCHRTSQSDETAALGIADLLGYLPLALAQVAAYVEESGCSLTHYLTLIKGNPSEALRLRPQSSDAEKAIATIWEISLKQLTTKSSDAVAILSLFSFLPPDRILHETLSAHAEKLPSPLNRIVTDGFRLNAAVAALRSYSLVNTTADGFAVHRLVQAVVRTRLSDDSYRLYSEAAKEIEGTLPLRDFRVTPKPRYQFWPIPKRDFLMAISSGLMVLLSGDGRKVGAPSIQDHSNTAQSETRGDTQSLTTVSNVFLNVPEIRKQKSNWDAPAIMLALAHFYGKGLGSQADWAQALSGNTEDVTTSLQQMAGLAEMIGLTATVVASPISTTEVKTTIDRGGVVVCRISWPEGAGHFVLISGYRKDGGGYYRVMDPNDGTQVISVESLLAEYRGSGFWTESVVFTPQDNVSLTERTLVKNLGSGMAAAEPDFRYQVALVSTAAPNARAGQFCGGTLIGRHWVVTSANCVVSQAGGLRNADLYVFAGSHKLSATGRRLAVQSIKWHSGFNPSDPAAGNDIALLRLADDLPIADSITPLTEALEQTVLKTVTVGVVSGWGASVQGSHQVSDDLTYASVPLIDRRLCNDPVHYDGRITAQMICAGGPDSDACQGDGGGPLVLRFGTTTYLYGIVSWGEGCGHANKPGVYTRVPAFVAWLNEAMR